MSHIIRIVLSLLLVFAVYTETGVFTAFVVFLFFLRAELQDFETRIKAW
jgi:hypothetical protein